MSLIEALLLGILQGLSEFLPISSTAHLTLAGKALGLVDPAAPEAWTAFLAVVQLGTLVAVLAYFRADVARLTRALLHGLTMRARRQTPNPRHRADERLAWLLILGTIPIALVGLLLRDLIESNLTKDLRLIATTLIALGLLLALAEHRATRTRNLHDLRPRDAWLIGSAQVLSLIPGASRSGTTLTGGLLLGLDRESAARYSFLLSIPAIAASGLLELPHALAAPQGWAALALATLAAALTGYATIALLLRYLRTKTTMPFVIYRVALGLGILALLGVGWIRPL